MAVDEKDVKLLMALIAQASASRFGKYCKIDFQVKDDCPELTDAKYASEIGMIMIWGSLGAVTLKVHFDIDVAIRYTAQSLGHAVDQVTEKTAREFVREMGNLIAGYLRGFFGKNKVVLGMSLPFLAKGEDESIFRKIRDPRAHFNRWILKSPLGDLNCTAEVLFLEVETIAILNPIIKTEIEVFRSKTEPDDGDVEFI